MRWRGPGLRLGAGLRLRLGLGGVAVRLLAVAGAVRWAARFAGLWPGLLGRSWRRGWPGLVPQGSSWMCGMRMLCLVRT